ncbi:MAG TPA: TIGR03986 family CRISPR-associated RAMP protein, partial [Pyrinomonadaceae bacterium]|nr:TIGR03986 family CRISPR-associated RAMP protein [Pyrinomonadaceae bacterium]
KYVTDFSKQKVYENFYIKPPVSRLTRKSSSSNVSLRLAITNKITNVDEEGLRKVNVVVSGQMQNKHMHCAVYELDEDAKPIGISEERWKIYQEDYKKVWDKKKPQRELKSGEPLFYFLDEKGEPVFGPTMMFRIPYNNTVRKFLDEDSKKLNTLDFTDAIFGKVPEKKDSAQKPFAGRVYFSDAVCQTVNPFLGGENDGRRVPKILSSPKPTAFQMYLNQPEPDNSTKKNYNNINETQIRGFKRYWHQPKITPDDVFDREQNIENVGSQHTIIRPVKPETNFKSRVYFENLSGIELGALLTALELPPNMRHQIGMAKPYGFGSIKITPALVLQNREVRYAALFNENNWMTGTDNNLTKDFKGEFEKTLIEFCKEIYGREEIKSLNEIPRIRQLYVLLEWEPNPNLKEKTYCNLQFEDRNGKKRAERQWRDRHVLPYPEHINSGESGELEFGASETENLENNNLESGKRVEEKEPEPQSHTFLTRPMVKKKT